MNYKQTTAEKDTVTRNTSSMEAISGNIYEALNVISKRADQITVELKDELSQKLEAFALPSDNLEEIFENREQIEISKFYEKLPKPVAIALEEFLNEKVQKVEKKEEEA
ncbi:MAG: RNA polymerase Rpb6 [Flavobacteriales bacterium]|jgi:DNA-directed RNA polymerase subunit K/omega